MIYRRINVNSFGVSNSSTEALKLTSAPLTNAVVLVVVVVI